MFIHRRITWREVALLMRRTTITRIWKRLTVVLIVAILVTAVHEIWPDRLLLLTPVPFTILGVGLGIFLGFRNSASYDRYWEGRKLWGTLVNECRSLTREILTFAEVPAGAGEGEHAELASWRREIIHLLAAFPYALKDHLRGGDDPRLGALLTTEELALVREMPNRPVVLIQWMGEKLQVAGARGWLHPYHRPLLEERLVRLTDVLGACERIKNTPIPFSYALLIHRIVGIYSILLPLGLVDSLGAWTPFMVFMITYAFMGLDDIAGELEDPFGTDPNDLPLSAISRSIEIVVRHLAGERDLPEPFTPHDGIVL